MHFKWRVPSSSSAYPHRWMAKFGREFLELWSTEVIHFWSISTKTQEKPFTDLFRVCAMTTFFQQRIVLTWDVEPQKQLWHFSRLALDCLSHIGGNRNAGVETARVRGGQRCASRHLSTLQRKCRHVRRTCYLACISRFGKQGQMKDRAETGSKGLDSEEKRCFDLVRGLKRIAGWAIKHLVHHFHPFFRSASSGLLFHPPLTKDNQSFHVCFFSCVRR